MRQVAILGGLLLVLLASLPPASAHAKYVSSDPAANGILPTAAAPHAVVVTVSEAIQSGTARLRVTNESGGRIDTGQVELLSADARVMQVALSPIGPGVYTVSWSAVSAVDGHFYGSAFAFAVLKPDGSLPGPLPTLGTQSVDVSLPEVAFRFLAFLGLALGWGTIGFALLVLGPVSGAGNGDPAGPRGLFGLAIVGFALFAGGIAGWWALGIGASPADLKSPFHASLAARLVLGVAMLALTFFTLRARRESTRVWGLRAVFAMGLAVAVAGSIASHGAAIQGWAVVGAIATAVHVAAIVLWVGGLAALVRLRPWLRDPSNITVTRAAIPRFSALAGYAVGVVLATSLVLALILVGTLEALFGTPYGLVVIAKAALFVPMVALGAWNRYRILPRLTSPEVEGSAAIRALSRNANFEVAVGAVVLAVAALLTTLTPAVSPVAAQSFSHQATEDGVRFDFDISPYPGGPGVYALSVQLWNATSGVALATATGVAVTFTLLNSTLSPQTIPLVGHGNHFAEQITALSQSGTWRIDALLSRTDGFDVRATFHLVV